MAARLDGPAGFRALGREPDPREKERLRTQALRLLAWQRSLRGFPKLAGGLGATPFVSLYARGLLLGCFGSVEGEADERLVRAFLRSLDDTRFGGVGANARGDLVAQVTYPTRLVEVSGARSVAEVPASFELGTHGVVVSLVDGRSSVVLPQVAREARLDRRGMIELALRKARGGAGDVPAARLWLFEACDVVARGRHTSPGDPLQAAEAWLARLVGADGSVAFGVDARTGARVHVGEAMHHGRAAVVVAALARRKHHAGTVARARKRLEADARAALSGKPPAGWPAQPAVVAGTLALACLAGTRLDQELGAYSRAHREALGAAPWHAAQVVSALGPRADPALMAACIRDLERAPWAPWTTLAARALGDRGTLARTEAALVDQMRARGPHPGGAGVTDVPEIALTAIAVEALAPARSAAARRAVARGRAFLRRWQLVGDRLGAAYHPTAALGAFPISPAFDALRCDVTGHAVLALIDDAGEQA